jgi:hypothetical protein
MDGRLGSVRFSEETLARHLDKFHRRIDIKDLVELAVATTLADFVR